MEHGVKDRIKYIREDKKLKRNQMAEALDMAESQYSRIEKGQYSITIDKTKTLIELFKVNPIWLLTGKGEPYLTDILENQKILKEDFIKNINDRVSPLLEERDRENAELKSKVLELEAKLSQSKELFEMMLKQYKNST